MLRRCHSKQRLLFRILRHHHNRGEMRQLSSTSTSVEQYGFYYDEGRCAACYGCTVACKSWMQVAAGPQKPLRMLRWEEGIWPTVSWHLLFAPCYHCANPVCVTAAGDGSLIKEPKYGAVLIDPAKANSPALRAAANACPYGAISFDSDAPDATAYKCTMCVDKLEQNQMPACVMACFMRALDFGKITTSRQSTAQTHSLKECPTHRLLSRRSYSNQ